MSYSLSSRFSVLPCLGRLPFHCSSILCCYTGVCACHISNGMHIPYHSAQGTLIDVSAPMWAPSTFVGPATGGLDLELHVITPTHSSALVSDTAHVSASCRTCGLLLLRGTTHHLGAQMGHQADKYGLLDGPTGSCGAAPTHQSIGELLVGKLSNGNTAAETVSTNPPWASETTAGPAPGNAVGACMGSLASLAFRMRWSEKSPRVPPSVLPPSTMRVSSKTIGRPHVGRPASTPGRTSCCST